MEKIRICADFLTGLNAALEDHEYPLQPPEELFTNLSGVKCFAKIDLCDAFMQVSVDDESKHFLTMNINLGLSQYNRLLFGGKTSPSIFQQIMDKILENMPRTVIFINDILIKASTEKSFWIESYKTLKLWFSTSS